MPVLIQLLQSRHKPTMDYHAHTSVGSKKQAYVHKSTPADELVKHNPVKRVRGSAHHPGSAPASQAKATAISVSPQEVHTGLPSIRLHTLDRVLSWNEDRGRNLPEPRHTAGPLREFIDISDICKKSTSPHPQSGIARSPHIGTGATLAPPGGHATHGRHRPDQLMAHRHFVDAAQWDKISHTNWSLDPMARRRVVSVKISTILATTRARDSASLRPTRVRAISAQAFQFTRQGIQRRKLTCN